MEPQGPHPPQRQVRAGAAGGDAHHGGTRRDRDGDRDRERERSGRAKSTETRRLSAWARGCRDASGERSLAVPSPDPASGATTGGTSSTLSVGIPPSESIPPSTGISSRPCPAGPPHRGPVVGAGMLSPVQLSPCPRGTGSVTTDPRGWKGRDLARFPREAVPRHWGVQGVGVKCHQLSLCLGPYGVTFGVTPLLSLRFRLVSTVQATMATVSGITVVLSCKNVVYDR